jgi:ELWxxDGT repeat protein
MRLPIFVFILLFTSIVDAGEQVPVLIKDCFPTHINSFPKNFLAAGSSVYFTALDGTNTRKLWKIDAAGNTAQVNAGFSLDWNYTLERPITLPSSTIFWASNAATGIEPWAVHETLGPVLLKDVKVGLGSSYAHRDAVRIGNTSYFLADNYPSIDLWKSDGTPVGTSLCISLSSVGDGGAITNLFAVSGKVYFTDTSFALWKTDGVTAVNLGGYYGGLTFFEFKGELWSLGFYDGDPVFSRHVDNGNSISSQQMANSWDGPMSTVSEKTIVCGNRIFFIGQTDYPSLVWSLWSTDGTSAGCVNLMPYGISQNVSSDEFMKQAKAMNGVLYFPFNNGVSGTELWRSDGTAAGTYLLKDISSGPSSSSIAEMTVVGNTLYFSANDNVNGEELWKSDGTSAGTVMIDIHNGGGGDTTALTNINGTLYFSGYHPSVGDEPFKLGLLTAPLAPTFPAAVAVSSSQINVTWSAPSGNESLFKVERKTGPNGTYAQITTRTVVQRDYSDTGLLPGTQYFYRIRSSNAAGDSPYSAEVSAITFSPPLPPSSLTAVAQSGTQINLTWVDNSSNETGFKVERKTGAGGTYALVTTTAAGATGFNDTSLSMGTQYFYRVRATNSVGDSSNSNEVNATTYTLPAAPSGLAATPINGTQIDLTWNDNSNNETGFKIERKTGIGGTYSEITTMGAGVTSFSNIAGLTSGTTYYYRVRATNQAGQSAYSSEVFATTYSVPATPTALMTNPGNGPKIIIVWNDNSSNETQFLIERKIGIAGTFFHHLAIGANAGTSGYAEDTSPLTAGTQYFYRIRASNPAGYSAYSNESSVVMLPNITVSASDAGAAESGDPCVFTLTRDVTAGSVTVNIGLDGSALNGIDYPLTPLTVVFNDGSATASLAITPTSDGAFENNESITCYIISAAGYVLGSQFSATATLYDYYVPGILLAANITSSGVKLTWDDPLSDESGYKLERKAGSSGTWAEIYLSNPNEVQFTDTNLIAGQDYYYRLRVWRGTLFSAYTDELKVTIKELPTVGIAQVIAGNGGTTAVDNVLGASSGLNGNMGVCTDSAGNVYIADLNNCRLRKVDIKTRIITTIAGNGTVASSGDGAAATSASLAFPTDVAVDGSGNIFIAEVGIGTQMGRIRKVTLSSGIISTVVGGGSTLNPDGIAATSAKINCNAISVDASGNLYVLDTNQSVVYKVATGTNAITRFAGGGVNPPGGDMLARDSSLNFPSGIATDTFGNLYIADTGYGLIRLVKNGSNDISTVVGGGTRVPANGEGPRDVSVTPLDVSVDSAGGIWFANNSNRVYRASDGKLEHIAGNGQSVFNSDGQAATNVAMRTVRLAVDAGLNVYCSTESNRVVRVGRGVLQAPTGQKLAVLEAENYSFKTKPSTHEWTFVTAPSGFSGTGAMAALPNSGTSNDTNYLTASPRMDYVVHFKNTGIHYVWVRGSGATGNDDSCHVGLDYQATATSDRMTGFTAAWKWVKATSDGPVATINVQNAGGHVLNLWMREDGLVVDKILITTDPAYTPSGTGPSGRKDSVPEAPFGLTAYAMSAAQANLSWQDKSDNEDQFVILRQPFLGENDIGTVGTVAANVTSFMDGGLEAGRSYTYYVKGMNTEGDSDWSNPATIITSAGGVAYNLKVNFQTTSATIPTGYLRDNGSTFGNRGNGYTYGWSTSHTAEVFKRNVNADQRLDTLAQIKSGAKWELLIPNGYYNVKVSVGDPSNATTQTLRVEGVSYWNGQALTANTFASMTKPVLVQDGRLTVDASTGADRATRINYIEIGQLDNLPPVIGAVTPLNDSHLMTAYPVISAEITDDFGVDWNTLQLSVNNSVVTSYSITGNVVSVPMTNPMFAEYENSVSLSISDYNGNRSSKSWVFTVDDSVGIIVHASGSDRRFYTGGDLIVRDGRRARATITTRSAKLVKEQIPHFSCAWVDIAILLSPDKKRHATDSRWIQTGFTHDNFKRTTVEVENAEIEIIHYIEIEKGYFEVVCPWTPFMHNNKVGNYTFTLFNAPLDQDVDFYVQWMPELEKPKAQIVISGGHSESFEDINLSNLFLYGQNVNSLPQNTVKFGWHTEVRDERDDMPGLVDKKCRFSKLGIGGAVGGDYAPVFPLINRQPEMPHEFKIDSSKRSEWIISVPQEGVSQEFSVYDSIPRED